MSFGTVYSYPNNPRVIKVRPLPPPQTTSSPNKKQTHAVANLNGLQIDEAPFQMGVTNRTPEFLSKFPLGKIPAFESADGSVAGAV